MCEGGIPEADVPPAILATARDRLDDLIADGLVTRADGRLAMTPQGRPFLRHLAACFDAYLKPSPARHSAAV